ncbi:MAG: hypothetical protein GEV11_23755, partial [Streptosporangiales bacterium]|nr:hypothetical protein [Streptosporangiales bacterium]
MCGSPSATRDRPGAMWGRPSAMRGGRCGVRGRSGPMRAGLAPGGRPVVGWRGRSTYRRAVTQQARPAVAVLADDLTGAHASAARLRAAGCRAVVTWRLGAAPEDTDALAVDMRTRDYGADPYARARRWAGHLRAAGVARIELRIDSTLRGDPGAELRGVLDGLAGEDVTVLAVPAFPGAGRLVRGGRLETPGLELPEERRDPGRLIFGTAAVRPIGLGLIAEGPEAIAAEIAARRGAGSRFFLADADSEAHLRVLATAADLLEHPPTSAPWGPAGPGRLVTVSPGAWLAYRRFPQPRTYALVVLSSRTETNRTQLDRLAKDHNCLILSADEAFTGHLPTLNTPTDHIPAPADDLSASPDGLPAPPNHLPAPADDLPAPAGDLPAPAGDHSAPADQYSAPGGGFPAVVVVETLSRRTRDGAEAWAQSTIAAQAAARVLETAFAAGARCSGIVCGGGQTASALMDVLDAEWLETEAEAAPLCPRSHLGSGPYAGLPLITKGGLVGTETTLSQLVTELIGGN